MGEAPREGPFFSRTPATDFRKGGSATKLIGSRCLPDVEAFPKIENNRNRPRAVPFVDAGRGR